MSADVLQSLRIGDKVAATPSWGTEWLSPLTVVATGETDDGDRQVSIRRSQTETEPRYDLVAEGARVAVYGAIHGRPYRRLGTVQHLERVGRATLVKRTRLRAAAADAVDDRPEGDDSWRRFYGGEA